MTSQVNEGPQIKLVSTDDGADDAALTPLAAVFFAPHFTKSHAHYHTLFSHLLPKLLRP